MKCPHCSSEISATAAACTACGFSAGAIRAHLGAEWVRLDRITDNSQRLSLRDTRHLEAVLDDFERRFPQCFVALFLGPLPTPLTVMDLGFWLINHGAFHTESMSKRNDYGIALVVDSLKQTVGFTVGYALEQVLTEPVLNRILTKVQAHFRKGNWGRAIEKAIKLIELTLKSQATKVDLDTDQLPPSLGDLGAMGLELLRKNHSSPASQPNKTHG